MTLYLCDFINDCVLDSLLLYVRSWHARVCRHIFVRISFHNFDHLSFHNFDDRDCMLRGCDLDKLLVSYLHISSRS